MVDYRIHEGEQIVAVTLSRVATGFKAKARMHSDTGSDQDFILPDKTTAAASQEVWVLGTAHRDGLVEGAFVDLALGGATKRGAFYAMLFISDVVGAIRQALCKGYCYAGHSVDLGEFGEAGPASGNGEFIIEALASDIAPAAITFTAASSNLIRKIRGWAWYYNCAAVVATRTLSTAFRRPFGALPTGFATAGASDAWSSSLLPSLTTGEEGSQVAYAEDGREPTVAYNDNGTLTYETAQNRVVPLPYWVNEDDPLTIIFTPAAADAADRHSLYIAYESWVVL